jgi:hypothetical protein
MIEGPDTGGTTERPTIRSGVVLLEAADEPTTAAGFDYPRGHHLVGTSHSLQDPPGNKGFMLSPLEQEHFEDEGDDTSDDHADGGPYSHDHIGSARTPWYATTILLLSEVMGTGVLSLPYAARTLGWVWTIIAVPVFAVVAVYSGWLLAFVKREFVGVGSYADAAKELFGDRFGNFTKACMLVNWGAIAIYYMIALSEGIGDLFGNSLRCSYERSLVAIAILILPCQW